RGVNCRVFVQDGDLSMPFPPVQLRALVREWFAPIEGPVEPLRTSLPPADFTIATHWSTAWSVRALGNARKLVYFVQDYEPAFYAAGAHAAFAEATYRLGFHGITAGRWLARELG